MPKPVRSEQLREIGLRIKDRRDTLRIHLKDVAAALGLTPTAIGQYERGEADPPASRLPALAEVLQCTVSYILGIDSMEDMKDEEACRKLLALEPSIREQARLDIDRWAKLAPRIVIYDEDLMTE